MQTRKKPRLSEFDYRENGAYFVTICTKNRRHCLSYVVGADAHIGPHTALTKWGVVVQTHMLKMPGIDKYVIMPNHVHMIVRIGAENGSMWASTPTNTLSNHIRTFKTLVTKEIGECIWQRSFYDHVIRNEAEYRRIWQYIDDNPAGWAEDGYYVK